MDSAYFMDEDEDEILPQDLTKNREERVKYKYSGLSHLDGDSANEACALRRRTMHPDSPR
jgi:hypothetical protein